LDPRDPDGINIEVEFFPPVVDPGVGSRADRINSMVVDCAKVFEVSIFENPNQWHMLQRFWSSDRKPVNAQ
jgi:lauroyl/myristoyl acyltransferase